MCDDDGMTPTLPEILTAACDVCALGLGQVLGKSRHPKLVEARRLYAFAARKHTHHSYPEIARAAGGRSHASVHDQCQRFAELIIDCGDTNAISLLAKCEARIQHLIERRTPPCPSTQPVRAHHLPETQPEATVSGGALTA